MPRKKKTAAVKAKDLSAAETTAATTDVGAMLEIASVVELTDATVKTKYENNADTNAYTDAEKTKLAGIEANATTDQTAAEVPITDAGGHFTGTDVEAALQELGAGGGGGGLTRSVDNPAAIGAASIQAVRLGGSAVTFGGDAVSGYTIGIPVGAEILQLDFSGSSTTTNASGELVVAIDNSANGYDRYFVVGIYDGGNDQKQDEFLNGNITKQEIAGNVTTVTIPNMNGYPNGFRLLMR